MSMRWRKAWAESENRVALSDNIGTRDIISMPPAIVHCACPVITFMAAILMASIPDEQ